MGKHADKKVEEIMSDVYALDPSLKEHDGEVRKLVSAMVASTPKVTPDRAFVTRLRREVALPRRPQKLSLQHAIPTPLSGFWWWTLHVAPVGAIAVLLLILIHPEDRFSPVRMPSAQSPQTPVSTESNTETPVPAANSKMVAPYTPSETAPSDEAGGAAGVSPQATTFSMQASDTQSAISGDSIDASGPQMPGDSVEITSATLSQDGFIQVFTYENDQPGEYLGASRILTVGSYTGIPVALKRPVENGEVLYARILVDNGDGKLNQDTDLPALDANNGFVYTIFAVTAQ